MALALAMGVYMCVTVEINIFEGIDKELIAVNLITEILFCKKCTLSMLRSIILS